MRLIVATKNQSKVKEVKKILSGLSFKVLCLLDLPNKFKIIEDGKTFFENAVKKSLPVSEIYKDDYVVGEDSGLVVKHLKGEPGIYSARYSGQNATDLKNNQKLLEALEGIPKEKRKARFVCCLSLATGGKEKARFKGELEGFIGEKLEGENGFGYDPLFYIPFLRKTAAQLTVVQKNRVSHRAKAFQKLKGFLLEN